MWTWCFFWIWFHAETGCGSQLPRRTSESCLLESMPLCGPLLHWIGTNCITTGYCRKERVEQLRLYPKRHCSLHLILLDGLLALREVTCHVVRILKQSCGQVHVGEPRWPPPPPTANILCQPHEWAFLEVDPTALANSLLQPHERSQARTTQLSHSEIPDLCEIINSDCYFYLFIFF